MFFFYRKSANATAGAAPTDSIAFDNATSTFPASSTSWTLGHINTGSNLLLVVFIQTLSATDDITGVTYNGVPMTFATKIQNPHSAGWLYSYVLTNPAVGTHNVVATFTTAKVGAIAAISYTGARQTLQPSTSVTSSLANSTTYSLTTTTPTNFEHLVAFSVDNIGSSAAGANTTRTAAFSAGSGQQLWRSTTSQTPAGSKTLNFTNADPSTDWVGIIHSIRSL